MIRYHSSLAVNCGRPPGPKNGFVKGDNYTYGGVVFYGCKCGFSLKGQATRRCQADGKWSGTVPTCESKSNILYSQ